MVELSETFWITLMGAAGAAFALMIRALSRSKCDNIEFCCIKIHRNIGAEIEEEKYELDHKNNNEINSV